MALLTKKEFAEICGMGTNALSVYIKRGKVVLNYDELIDDEREENLDFLARKLGVERREVPIQIPKPNPVAQTRVAEKPLAQAPVSQKPVAQDILEKESISDLDEGIPDLRKSEKLLKHLDTQKRQKEIEKLEIEIAKKRGELIPVELVSLLFTQFSKSIINAFQNAGDNLIMTFGHKRKMTREEIGEIKFDLVSIINQANDNAISDSKKNLKNIVEEYSEKRGRGER